MTSLHEYDFSNVRGDKMRGERNHLNKTFDEVEVSAVLAPQAGPLWHASSFKTLHFVLNIESV
jgi:hypothetical protein